MEQSVKLFTCDLLFFHQQIRTAVQNILMVGNNLFGLCVAVFDNGADFLVDLSRHVFTVSFLVADVIAQEDVFASLLIVDRADRGRHSVARDHLPGDIGRLFDIL